MDKEEEWRIVSVFAERKGIRIADIPEAFHRCWRDNGDLVKDNQKLQKDNEELKSELKDIYDVAMLNKAISIINNIYDDYLSKDPNDEFFDAKREAILECLEKLYNFRDTMTEW